MIADPLLESLFADMPAEEASSDAAAGVTLPALRSGPSAAPVHVSGAARVVDAPSAPRTLEVHAAQNVGSPAFPGREALVAEGEGRGGDARAGHSDDETGSLVPTASAHDGGSEFGALSFGVLSGSGSGSGSGSCSGEPPPVAADDTHYSFADESLDLYVHFNDEGAGLSIISVGASSNGQGVASIVGSTWVNYDANSDAYGWDSFTYTVEDACGRTDTATVTVFFVEITHWTLERQLADESWTPVPAGEVSWSHDTLRWTRHYTPSGFPLVEEWVGWYRQDRDAPAGWELFAETDNPEKAIGNPGAAKWDIKPIIEFSVRDTTLQGIQDEFAVQFIPDPAEEDDKDVAEIDGIEWVDHADNPAGNPAEAGELTVDAAGQTRFYPDATAPGGDARKKVDIEIIITPALPNVTLYLWKFDVDDATDDDGPIDDDGQAVGDLNADNFPTNNGVDPAAVLPFSVTTDANGRARPTFEINWIQPGNNFRAAAAPRQPELFKVQPLADDDFSRLFYDANDNTTWESLDPEEFLLDESGPAPAQAHGIQATPTLTVWRRLHMEVESMGQVSGNIVHVVITGVTDNQDGTSTVTLQNQLTDDLNRFEGGNLIASSGDFVVLSSAQNSVIVDNLVDAQGNPVLPPLGNAELWDDDGWLDGDDVDMPDTSELGPAMEKAFIEVSYYQDLQYTNNWVPFDLTVDFDVGDPSQLFEWDSRGDNSAEYWVAYVLAAFQGRATENGVVAGDNDPDSEAPTLLGRTALPIGGSFIFMETIRDRSWESQVPTAQLEQDIVVHEVAHAVGNNGSHPVTLYEVDGATFSRYTEDYLRHIRTSNKPAS
ncbi:MAG: hypothetical protein KY475_07210 [Planctomycetes bacterium]|nr:hypothetical protein [Planctomycetota bacterium]